ncbi:unnamed protein product [Closterium sp. Yama58-4]|nr:unnamed protein product [Closterium sp. Yama58-4]
MTARGKQQQHALLPSSLISSVNPATFFSNRPVRLVFVGGRPEGGAVRGAEGGGGALGGWQQGDRGEPVRVLQAEIARYREGQRGVIATGLDHDGGRGDGGGLAGGGKAQAGEMGGGILRGEEGDGGEADGAAMAAFIPSLSDADGDTSEEAFAQSEKEKAQLAAELAKVRGAGGGAGGVAAAAAAAGGSAAARSPGFGLCMATTAEMRRYLNYTKRAACPHDWRFVEHLCFARNCLHLPRRRCRATALTPPDFQEYSLGFPAAVFAKDALRDENVRWGEGMRCGSYKECVEVSKEEGAVCKGCFDVELEQHWWDKSVSGTIPLKAFLKLKPPGALRIGLDVGGGTGGFAAVMALHNITIITTGMNTDGGREDEKAVPYMQTIAQRGLVPLYLPHSAPLPFFDNTLDLIHTLNSIKYPHLAEFEAMLYEWDRVVRPGGLWWIEMFYAPDREMKAYVQALEAFGYGKRYWSLARKQRPSERKGNHFVLTCVLEKPLKLQA